LFIVHPSSYKAMDDSQSRPSLLERLSALIMREPEDREQLMELLRSSYERNLLDADALAMIEGVLQVAEMQARDIMVPRSQMDVIDINESPGQFIPMVIQTAHSRFPVIGENKDDVIGILLAKDLLRYYAGEEEFNVREMLRPAVFIPESKPLNVLLKEFRKNRNHIAIVVDEYGGVAGLITIEDVLEQIVGDIEDEYDFDDVEDNIVQEKGGQYRVKALTDIADFNSVFGTRYRDEGVDTIGGLILKRFGRVPKRGEQISFDNLTFKILRADSRRLHLLQVAKKGASKG
jgi:hemolysin (HlyC) family protein